MVEEQALCRVHRVGQQRDVTTVRYLMKDSFEEVRNLLGYSQAVWFFWLTSTTASCGDPETEENACTGDLRTRVFVGGWYRIRCVAGKSALLVPWVFAKLDLSI